MHSLPGSGASSPAPTATTPATASSAASLSSGGAKTFPVWRILGFLIVVTVGGFFALRLASPAASPAVKRAAPVVPIVAALAQQGEIGVYINALGTITPLNQVVVRPRIDGQLMALHFSEGQWVQAGDLLAEIDPQPYAVLVAQAEAQLARAEALLKNASLDLARYVVLSAQNTISQQALEAQQALVAQLEAEQKSGRAQLDSAKIRLSYARITAPLSGRVGFRQLDPGNMVRAGDAAGLLSIAQEQPITAVFTIAQDNLPPVLRKWSAGEKLVVDVYDRGQKTKIATGHLQTLDNQIDPTTGTLKCKAVFTNEDRALFPNQFVNIRLLVEQKRGVLLVPAAAIQRGAQQSSFVYVASPEKAEATATTTNATNSNAKPPVHVISLRPVVVLTSEGDFVEISAGLQPGEIVVLEGVDRLQAGSRVSLRMRSEASPVSVSAATATPAAPNAPGLSATPKS